MSEENVSPVWERLTYDKDALIEASAGTGKTYTLEKIVLELVKRGYEIPEILLVTYTDKAAGELKDRIRKALEAEGKLPVNFDEATICTIHSFCQQLLRQYAFENGLSMECEVGSDDELIGRAVHQVLTGTAFSDAHLMTYSDEMRILKTQSDGLAERAAKRIRAATATGMRPSEGGDVDAMREDLLNGIRTAAQALESIIGGLKVCEWASSGCVIHGSDAPWFFRDGELLDEILPSLMSSSKQCVLAGVAKWRGAKHASEPLNPRVTGRGRGARLESVHPELRPLVLALDKANEIGALLETEVADRAWAIFQTLKADASILTYDDMIRRTAEVVRRESERDGASELLASIRRHYRVALVDEFQDTDGLQWEIFRKVFSSGVNPEVNGKKGFLLVVGDPKQAIYSFRGADLNVYFKAKEAICGNAKPLSLGEMHRSDEKMIGAFNDLFSGDWFSAPITYEKVTFPQTSKNKIVADATGRGPVTLIESLPKLVKPITKDGSVKSFGNRDRCLPLFLENAAAEMLRLHNLGATALKTWDPKLDREVPRKISYHGMMVLVETNDDAKIARRIFSRHGIPYEQYKEKGLCATAEAEAVLAFLDYMASPAKSGNRAALLMTGLFGVPPNQIEEALKGDPRLDRLAARAAELAAKRKWYQFFDLLVTGTAVSRPRRGDFDFDRRFAAVRQVCDKLVVAKGRSGKTVAEFADLLREWRAIDKQAGEDGTIRERESEDDRVQIMTMHASKGLEGDVVFVPWGFSPAVKRTRPGDPERTQEQKDAEEAERRRLLYVAITRAKYKVYLPGSADELAVECGFGSKGAALLGDGFLRAGINRHFAATKPVVIGERAASQCWEVGVGGEADGDVSEVPEVPEYKPPSYTKQKLDWDSFTTLEHGVHDWIAPDEEKTADLDNGEDSADDDFGEIQTILPRNNVSGNVFHGLMEALCRNADDSRHVGFNAGACAIEELLSEQSEFRKLVRQKMGEFAMTDRPDGRYERALGRMAWTALRTELDFGDGKFRLADIPQGDRRAEVRFVLSEKILLGDAANGHDGLFNGSIDLLIRRNGRYGILDWKTNTLRDYEDDSVKAAMLKNKYTLQFQLYAMAAEAWLGTPPIGAAYLFVRGGEKEGGTCGVYLKKAEDVELANRKAAVAAALNNAKRGGA